MKLLIVAVLLGAACGSKTPATTPPTTGSSNATVALPDVPFEDLDLAQREEFMKQKVVPTMKPLFQQHDPKRFEDFGCPTCHGEDARAAGYPMPNPALPKLNFADMSKFKPADVEFMKTQVLPTMAKLLQEPIATAESTTGFSCLECHTEEGK